MSAERPGIESTNPSEPLVNLGERIVVFMGAEGSGKSTIGERLAKESGKPFISVGQVLRDIAANDPGELGDLVRETFAKRTYLMDRQKLLDMYASGFQREDLAKGFVLDGALRDTTETNGFQEALDRAGRSMPVDVVFLRIPGDLSYSRLVFNEDARKREDDTPEGVASRLANYNDRLGERVGIIKNQPGWKFINIDATQNINTTYGRVLEGLDLTTT